MNEVRALRKSTGMSQNEFANRFNIPVRTLQQWEQELQKPPEYVLKMMEKILKTENEGAALSSKYISHVHAEPSVWKVCISEAFENCEQIYPIQQRKVKSVIDSVKGNPAVKKVVIFGSSVNSSCHMGSDLDIYIDLKEDINPLSLAGFNPDWEYDLFTNFMIDERLRREISAKGVKVYEQ